MFPFFLAYTAAVLEADGVEVRVIDGVPLNLTEDEFAARVAESAPDLLLGFEADPATRNVFGLMAEHPDPARRGIRLRSFGQGILETIAGRKVHSPGIVPGGIADPMTRETREWMLAGLVLMGLFVLAFPVFRFYEPAQRADAHAPQRRDDPRPGCVRA